MYTSTLLTVLLPALATAHFQIVSPSPRGFDEDKLGTFPCGGQDTVSDDRTRFPLMGGTIQLSMEHDEAAVQVLLALGNDPGDGFNITLLSTVQEQGIGDFCIGALNLPPEAMDGVNATIQVVTNGDPTGGLYNCADITFSSSAMAGECKNGTGVSAGAIEGGSAGGEVNANQTQGHGHGGGDDDHNDNSASTSASAGAASATGSAGVAATSSSAANPGAGVAGKGGFDALMVGVVSWMVGAAVVGGGMFVL